MAKMTAKRRSRLRKSSFGLPGQRKYPMPDKSHAIAAKVQSTRAYKRGKLSKQARDKIHAKANRKLGKGKSTRRR